jgi:predicted transcriptional regulator
MTKKPKLRITADGVKGFFDRAHAHARKLGRGEELAPEITVSFENATDMIRVLSPRKPHRAAPTPRPSGPKLR